MVMVVIRHTSSVYMSSPSDNHTRTSAATKMYAAAEWTLHSHCHTSSAIRTKINLWRVKIEATMNTSTSNPFLCAADFFLQLGSCKEAIR